MPSKLKYHKNYTEFGEPYQQVLPLNIEGLVPDDDSVRLLSHELENLVKIYTEEDESMETWEKITIASTIGGIVINTAGVTLAHGMAHSASGLKDIVHGQGLAALTPVIMEVSYKGNPEKFGQISRFLGITEAAVLWMAENCMKVSAGGMANNPVVFTEEEIAEIYKKAL